jgi:hypothetical protein
VNAPPAATIKDDDAMTAALNQTLVSDVVEEDKKLKKST